MKNSWIAALLLGASFALMATFAAAQIAPGQGERAAEPSSAATTTP